MNMMNMNLLTAEQLALAIQLGKDWGHAEARLWRDQNPDKTAPEWTLGTYCGTFPDDVDDDDEVRDVFEATLDDAARKAWDAYFAAESEPAQKFAWVVRRYVSDDEEDGRVEFKQPDGTWGSEATAAKFDSADEAKPFADTSDYGMLESIHSTRL